MTGYFQDNSQIWSEHFCITAEVELVRMAAGCLLLRVSAAVTGAEVCHVAAAWAGCCGLLRRRTPR